MGKRLTQQKRGKGSPAYKTPSHRFKAKTGFRNYDALEKESSIRGEIIGFVDDPGHQSLLMQVLYENGDISVLPATEGLKVGDHIDCGISAKAKPGNILPLGEIPEGSYIYNLEVRKGDKGKFVRSPGSYATLVAREGDNIIVKLPSKRLIKLSAECRAQIGVVAGGGRLEKPMLTAGHAHHKTKATNSRWPKVRGVAMNPVDHPHGGKQHHAGTSTSVSRNASPGQKVGHIASKRTGRKKKS